MKRLSLDEQYVIKRYGETVVANHLFPGSMEINTTSLAEDMAHNSPLGDLDYLLDEEDGVIWELSLDVASEYENELQITLEYMSGCSL